MKLESNYCFAGPLRLPPDNSLALAHRCTRPLALARRIAGKHRHPPGANPLDFLESYFGRKFATRDARCSPGSKVYQKSRHGIPESSLLVEFALSLSTTRYIQIFHQWLNQAPAAHFLSPIGASGSLSAHSMAQPLIRSELSRTIQFTVATHEKSREILPSAKQFLRTISCVGGKRPAVNGANISAVAVNKTSINSITLGSASAHEVAPVARHANYLDTALIKPGLQRSTLHVGSRASSLPGDFRGQPPPAYLLPLHLAFLRPSEAQPQQEAVAGGTAMLKRQLKEPLVSELERRFDAIENIVSAFNTRTMGSFTPSTQLLRLTGKSEVAREGLLASVDSSASFKSLAGKFFVPNFNRDIVAGDFRLPKVTDESRAANIARQLILLRREESLPLPPLGYVFTHPARPTVEEERAVKKADQREVVEIVKKEVQALMSSGSPMNFSRAEYESITDQVYSALMRRLVVEKERLGLSQ